MVSLRIRVNFSTSAGHESLKRLACEKIKNPNAATTRNVRARVIEIATTRFILMRTKKLTTG